MITYFVWGRKVSKSASPGIRATSYQCDRFYSVRLDRGKGRYRAASHTCRSGNWPRYDSRP